MTDTQNRAARRVLRREMAGTIGLLTDEHDFTAMRRYRTFAFDDHTAYLQQGDKGSAIFAPGDDTTTLRQLRSTRYAPTPQVVTQFADEAADPAQYPPVALRLKDGGALVFFTSHHQMKQTVAKPPLTITDPDIKALMTGTRNTSITLVRIAEQAVRVPAASATGTKVVFLNRIEGLVTAQGA